ncbi:hypothetical protein ALC62_01088 [Cyphomyrmex costatus]|uniref:Uncharacterized protein n=1 Tax=Cyphomyrmex costatus TaxID=456900 RepID=A0A195D4Y1_9HYME|nr:hypothetical protein ALC62_01088 [Cyphomyrmex costatus]
MSDRPRARTWYTFEANLPESFFTRFTQHRTDLSHEFDWDNRHILDREHILNKRLISKIIHIKRQKLGLTLQNMTHFLLILYIQIYFLGRRECFYSILFILAYLLFIIYTYCH